MDFIAFVMPLVRIAFKPQLGESISNFLGGEAKSDLGDYGKTVKTEAPTLQIAGSGCIMQHRF